MIQNKLNKPIDCSFWDANCRAGSSDHGQCNRRVTSPTWEPPRWSHQSISLSVAPSLSPKIVGAKRSFEVKILNQLTQLTQLTLQGLQCIFLAYEGHHRLLRSAFPDRETGQGSTGTAETKGSSMIFYDLLWSSMIFYDLLVKYLVLMQTWCEVDTSIAEAVNKHQISSDQNPDDRHASTKICLTPSWKLVVGAWIQHLQTYFGTALAPPATSSKSLGEARHSHPLACLCVENAGKIWKKWGPQTSSCAVKCPLPNFENVLTRRHELSKLFK